jgi:SNF2 domain-containing protein/SNF2 helicase protein/helicase-like protein
VTALSGERLEGTFVPGDPARGGRLALWHQNRAVAGATDRIVLAVPGPRGVRRRRTAVRLLDIGDALTTLLDPPAEAAESLRAWSVATLTGLSVLAAGRLAPGASSAGYGTWRAGPLDTTEAAWLRRFVTALPAEAYAAVLPGSGRALLPAPETVVTAYWDALADTLARDGSTVLPPFSAAEPVPVGGYSAWVRAIDGELRAAVRLVLRVGMPTEPDAPFEVVLWLRSASDPSLLVPAAELWRAPDAVLARFGADTETQVLLALRRAARVWPALAPALSGTAPDRLALSDTDLDELLSGALDGTDVEVLWPAELIEHRPVLAASTAKPAAAGNAAFQLDDLLEFEWQATLDGTALTAAEVAALAEAKRPLVRLRGRWVRVDRDLVARLRRRRGKLPAATALAATLTGSLELDGAAVEFRPDPALGDLAGRLTALRDGGPESWPEAPSPGRYASRESGPPESGTEGASRAVAPAPDGLAATLRPYQRRGLAWLAGMCAAGLGGCLADDMGLGKTVQVIALHLHRLSLHCGPTLVVCPTSLLGNWERELARFAPGVPVRRFHGAARELGELADGEVVLATYGVLRRDRARLAEYRWGLVVADEAQHVKNPLSRTAKELRAVPAAARVALTGTPVENRLSDLWSILDWTTPGLLGTLESFRQRVAIPVERYGDADAAARLSTVVRPFLLRRRKSDPGIAPELPPKTETDRLVPLTAEQVTLYEAVVRDTMDDIRAADGVARRGLVLKLLTALKQICNHPAQYLGEPGPVAGRSGKLGAVDELLDVILTEGDSVLVFSQYVGMCRLLERHLADRGIGTLLVHGGVPVARREERVRRFQDGEVPVFLLSLKAAGTGLNLTRASHVIHYDRWWNPAVEDQATDRAYRIGQDRPVQVHRLVTEHTVEDRVAALIAEKRALADTVVGTGEAWLTELSDTDLAELVSLGAAT